MMSERLLRVGLGLLAASAAMVGVWALFAPETFFSDFPGNGHTWVSALPPYNEHLTRDYGSMNLAIAVVLAMAAATLSRSLVLAGLAAVLVNAVPHLVFHASHQGALSDGDQIANLAALAVLIVVAAMLLIVQWRRAETVADR